MANSPATIKKPPVFRLILLQCICTVTLAAGFYVWKSDTGGLSALLGGLIAILPSAWFAWRAFRYNGTRQAERIVGSFYMGEAGKFALLAVLFALVFKLVEPLHIGALFGAFIVTLLAGIGASIWALPRPQMKSLQDTKTRDI
ncbi:MAG: ATP synthase subunit I [Pseudomonadales bacterium]